MYKKTTDNKYFIETTLKKFQFKSLTSLNFNFQLLLK